MIKMPRGANNRRSRGDNRIKRNTRWNHGQQIRQSVHRLHGFQLQTSQWQKGLLLAGKNHYRHSRQTPCRVPLHRLQKLSDEVRLRYGRMLTEKELWRTFRVVLRSSFFGETITLLDTLTADKLKRQPLRDHSIILPLLFFHTLPHSMLSWWMESS